MTLIDTSSLKTKKSLSNDALRKMKRHSIRVKNLRRVLPALSIFLILGVILWINLDSFLEEKIEGIPQTVKRISVLNKVKKPRFHMTDNDGNPIRIQAKSGTQKSDTKTHLVAPSADFVGPDGEQITLTANKAFIDQETQKFVYVGDVRFISDQGSNKGFDVRTDKITVNLKTKNISSETPVIALVSMGRLTSPQGFFFKGKDQELTFIGETRLIISREKYIETEIVAQDGIICQLKDKICRAKGGVVTIRKSPGGRTKMTSDFLQASFSKESGTTVLENLIAEKNVKIIHGKLGFKAVSQFARYNVAEGGTLLLTGKPILSQGENVLYVGRELVINERNLTAKTKGRSTLKIIDKLLQADHMTLFFKKNLEGRLKMDHLTVNSNVKLSTPHEFVTAQKGVYYAGIKVAELFGKVHIKRDIGIVQGQYARFDMVTGESQLKSTVKKTGVKMPLDERVHLVLEPL